MPPRRRSRTRLLVAFLALRLAAGATPASAIPSEGSTLAGDRGAVADTRPTSGLLAAETFAGAAGYTLPLELPPGTGGLTPSLALHYSSAARGDSWVGAGWSLGLPSIARSLRHGPPRYDDAIDRFELDGQELVPDAIVAGRFHTRRESFLRIEREPDGSFTVRQKDGVWLRLGTSAESRVDDGAGHTFQWLASEMHDPRGNAFAVRWDRRDPGTAYLAELRYTLRRDAAGDLHSLDDDPARDRMVRFDLEPRPDLPTSRLAGFERTMRHRLRSVEVRAAGTLVRRWQLSYLRSADSGRSLLASVALFGADGDDLAPTPPWVTSFRYRENAPVVEAGWGYDAAWSAAWPATMALVRDNGQDRGVRIVDVDGDALPDLVRALGDNPANGGDVVLTPDSGVYLSNGAGFDPNKSAIYGLPVATGVTGNRIPLAFAMRFPSGEIWGTGMTPLDLTGDGRVDFVGAIGFASGTYPGYSGPLAQSYQGPWCEAREDGFQCLAPSDFYRDGRFFTGVQGAAIDFSTLRATTLFVGGNTQFADVDGDGLPDLVVRGQERMRLPGDDQCLKDIATSYVARNLGGLRFEALPLDPTPPPYTPNCQKGRVIVSLAYQPCRMSATCIGWISHEGTQLLPSPIDDATWILVGHQDFGAYEVDLDGDGLADMVSATMQPSNPIFHTYLGDGREGYTETPAWNPPRPLQQIRGDGLPNPWSEGRSVDPGMRFADVNGDGRLDLVYAPSGGRGGAVWLSAGLDATGASPWRLQDAAHWSLPPGLSFVDAEGRDLGVRLVDLDGDGMPEIVHAQRGTPIEVWHNQGAIPDLLVEVVEPLGGRTRLDYTPSTRFDHRGDDLAPDLPRVLPLLTRIETDDGRGASSARTLSYAGGRFDPARRELRGFRVVIETAADGTRTVTRFHQDEARSGLVESVARFDAAGALWLETQHEYTPDDDGLEPFVSLPAATTSIAYDGGAAPRRTRVEWQYDGGGPITLGNRTATVELGEVDASNRDLDPGDTRSTVVDYAPENVALHLADRPTARRLLAGLPASGRVLRETRLLYDGAVSPAVAPTAGLVTQRTDVLAESGQPDPTTRFAYDVYGNLVALVDPRTSAGQGGGVTVFGYDGVFHAFRSAVVNALGQRLELGYAPDPSCPPGSPFGVGLVASEAGPNERKAGTARIRCYDAFGRITRERSPDGLGLTAWRYDDRPGLAAVLRSERTTQSGASRSALVAFDGLGRPVLGNASRASGPSVLEETSYDALGRVATRSAPHFAGAPSPLTRYAYDPLGRVIETQLPGAGRSWRVDRAPRTVTLTDPLGHVVRQQRDAFGRIVAIEEENAGQTRTTRYAWSPADELVSVEDAAGNRVRMSYDALGRRRSLDDPDLGAVRTAYDANGNEIEQTTPSGRVTYAYDALDRPLERRLDGAVEARFGYDTAWLGIGRLAWREDGAGRHTVHAYDAEGRPLVESDTRGGSTLFSSTSYDPLGQPAARTYPSGDVVEWRYDDAGQLARIDARGAPLASALEWNADGSLRAWRGANGVAWTAQQDAATGLPAELRVASGSTGIESQRFVFDAADRVLRIDDALDTTRSRSFVHDALGRLEQATGPFAPGPAPATLHYAYDLAGSLACKDASALVGCAGGTRLDYPAAGSPRPHAPTQVDGVAATHTPSGHLETLGDRGYRYDALGRLVLVTEKGRLTALHAYDAGGARARSFDLSGGVPHTRLFVGEDFEWDLERGQARIHVFLGGGPVATLSVPFAPSSASGASAAAAATRSSVLPRPPAADPAWPPIGYAAATLGLLVLSVRGRSTRPAGRRSQRQQRSAAKPGVAAMTTVSFLLSSSLPAWALAPDGDLNLDRRLDAADVLLAFEIARGARPASVLELAHGDVAPLGAAPEVPSRIDPGDVALLLRALGTDDVDGDGLSTSEELALGTSPFSSDSDGDGLGDARELAVGADPTDPDTDGDGRPDGADPDPRRGIVYRQLDALGSPLVVTRDDGAVLARPVYRPFGDAVPGAPGPADRGFNGRRRQPALGLYDYGARFYDPALGRFLQADAVVADPFDPGAWNRYAYAGQDPLRRVDPTGHVSVLGALFGAAVGAIGAAAWSRGDDEAVGLLGGLLNVATGAFGIRVSVRQDGAIAADLGYIPTIRWFPGQDHKPVSQQETRLRVVTTAELRFGDVLLTDDGGLAAAIGHLQLEGEGHAAFVLHADAYTVQVASADDRGRYVETNVDPSVGGRRWLVLRTGEPLDRSRVDAYLDDLRRNGGLYGGLRQYLDGGGRNVCSSFTADLYRMAHGRRIPPEAFPLVTPDELVRFLGPPIGKIYVPRVQELRNATPDR
ncbi:MAG TPA: toxin TcdB middle/N-terminal domain-containing protein [Myxococcota bacterium]|nr:toxin TcdB middle/N-terminal domain-containing protein [Myxococcota bacterium]